LSDVDGTLVTSEKRLTDETLRAVQRLGEEGILFAITSGRPPRGLAMLIEPLELTTPIAAFNGGLIVDKELSTLEELSIKDEFVGSIIEILSANDLSVWVYQRTDWFVLDLNGLHVAHEAMICQFSPTEVATFDDVRGNIIKVVGVSDDPEVVARGIAALNKMLANDVSATSSQSYYVDVTHRDANKGSVVAYLTKNYTIDPSEIAVIGDMTNDVLMFARAGLSFAVANAPLDVQKVATHVTSSNNDNGFATAMDQYILGPR
jgi:hypothetical protein